MTPADLPPTPDERIAAAYAKLSSRFLGVTWHKGRRQWRATILYGGRRRDLGFFSTEIEAARAYDIGHGALSGLRPNADHGLLEPPAERRPDGYDQLLLFAEPPPDKREARRDESAGFSNADAVVAADRPHDPRKVGERSIPPGVAA